MKGRAHALAIWGPRLGDSAAQDLYEAWLLLLIAPLLAVVWIPLDIAGAVAKVPALWVAGIGVMAVEGVLLVRLAIRFHRFRKAADAHFGQHIRLRDMPPLDEERYRQWCGKRGLSTDSQPRT